MEDTILIKRVPTILPALDHLTMSEECQRQIRAYQEGVQGLMDELNQIDVELREANEKNDFLTKENNVLWLHNQVLKIYSYRDSILLYDVVDFLVMQSNDELKNLLASDLENRLEEWANNLEKVEEIIVTSGKWDDVKAKISRIRQVLTTFKTFSLEKKKMCVSWIIFTGLFSVGPKLNHIPIHT